MHLHNDAEEVFFVLSGKIKVTGDMTKMMQMQTSMPQDAVAKDRKSVV